MGKLKRTGDRVAITRKKSVIHFKANKMPICGVIVKIEDEHKDGIVPRPIQVRFDDGRVSWWGSWELKKL